MHPYVHRSLIYNSQDVEAAQVPISRCVDEKAVVHLHSGILLGHKKEGNLTLCDSTDGPGDYCEIIMNEISQSEEDKYHMISLIYGI